jgi:hydroxyacylglutathione hydrolase
MGAVEILEELFFIERGYLNANHFVSRSAKPALIDTGYLSGYAETIRRIEELGVSVTDVDLIVSTHCHCDHIGGNRRIQSASGCDIALHRIGKHFIDHRDDWSTWWRYYDQKAEFFTCTRPLEDGERISIGTHSFNVIHTPGHAADGIALYHENEKILISSDALWENDMAVMTLRVEGSRALFEMEASLQKLARLDVKIVYPGHGRPFADFRGAIERALKRVSRFKADREAVGNDVLKKIIIYTLMMRKSIPSEALFPLLMKTVWFPETIDLYFNGQYDLKYEEILGVLKKRILVREREGRLFTTVKP